MMREVLIVTKCIDFLFQIFIVQPRIRIVDATSTLAHSMFSPTLLLLPPKMLSLTGRSIAFVHGGVNRPYPSRAS